MVATIIFQSFWILIIINTLLSFISKVILSSNEYKVTFLVSQPRYEISSLWELSKTKKSIRKLALIYTILNILFWIDLFVNIISLIANLP